MKIRTGFVSNSSSSSFVCIGIPLDDYPKLTQKFWDENEYAMKKNTGLPKNTSCGYFQGIGLILGWVLAYGSSEDGSFHCKDVDFDELKEYGDDFEAVTGLKPKLIGGTSAS